MGRAVKKKYQRKKPPTPPMGPYPLEKKERKKAQNRTAAFRYREKKKGEQNTVEEELELLATRNKELRAKLTEMETEARLLKKLMTMARRMIQFNPRTLMFPKQHSREETFLLVKHLNFLKCFYSKHIEFGNKSVSVQFTNLYSKQEHKIFTQYC